MTAYYPGAEFPTSEAWVDDVTPLDAANLNKRDDEIRAIEHALGTNLVPDTSAQLGTYARGVRVVTPASSHLILGGNGHDVVVGPYGTAVPKGPLHVYRGASGLNAPNANADNVVIEDNSNTGLSILFPLASVGNIYFGSGDGSTQLSNRGRIQYHGTAKELRLGSNEVGGKVILSSGQNVTAFTLDENRNAAFAGDVAIAGSLTGDVHATGDLTVDGDVTIGAATAIPQPLMNKAATTSGAYFENSGDAAVAFYFDADRGATGQVLGRFYGRWGGNNVAQIGYIAGGDAVNKDAGEIAFYTSDSGSNPEERVRIRQDGTVDFANNIVLSEQASTPPEPAASIEARLYLYNDKLVVQFKQAGVVYYKWLALNDATVAWQQSTSPPT